MKNWCSRLLWDTVAIRRLMTTIKCVAKDVRVVAINVGDLGVLLKKETTVHNTWYHIEFPATMVRAKTSTYYREPEFKRFFEVVEAK
jgi:hypothetical protein